MTSLPGLTGSLTLSAGVVVEPVDGMPAHMRRALRSEEGDHTISRADSRTHSKLLDAMAAALIEQFAQPSTVAYAVARLCKGKNLDPERLLEEALPMLASLVQSGFLVPAEPGAPSQPLLSPGSDKAIEGWTVLRCVQAMEDTETYLGGSADGSFGVIKIAHSPLSATGIENEARTLSELDSVLAPRLLHSATWNERPYIIVDWIFGSHSDAVCHNLRRLSEHGGRRELLKVTGSILKAYAGLHKLGFLHGDVHPRNVLIDRQGTARLIDFDLSVNYVNGFQFNAARRGGVSFFFEPEFAQAAVQGRPIPAPSPIGEQYSLATLLYLLITGSHYAEFSLRREEMLRQIAEAPMRTFVESGAEPWPAVEALLQKALSKSPGDRFESVADFARAWLSVEPPFLNSSAVPGGRSRLHNFRVELVKASGLDGSFLNGNAQQPPRETSVADGSAGVAYALYRIACATDDAELLSLSDIWSTKAVSGFGTKGAFETPAPGISSGPERTMSLYHGAAGARVVQAIIANARGDFWSKCDAVRAFIEACAEPCVEVSLAHGRAGALLGSAILLDTFGGDFRNGDLAIVREALVKLGDRLLSEIEQTAVDYGPIATSESTNARGISLGWAGLLYSALAWCETAKESLPASFERRLCELAACAEPIGRGLRWRTASADDVALSASWCAGSAGHVFLWTLAHAVTKEAKYLELATGGAWHCWEADGEDASLCYGLAGQAYALLRLYRHTSDSIWLQRARQKSLAAIDSLHHKTGGTASHDLRKCSLYYGSAGLAVLTTELERPDRGRVPMFDREA